MKVFLGESDNFLTQGEIELVIIKVIYDSGKEIQFPYSANETIRTLYKIISSRCDEKIIVPVASAPSHVAEAPAGGGVSLVSSPPALIIPLVDDNEIHKECLV